jgi:hypothetical protein
MPHCSRGSGDDYDRGERGPNPLIVTSGFPSGTEPLLFAGQLPQPLPQPADFRAAKYFHPRRARYPTAIATMARAMMFCMKKLLALSF